MSRMENSIISVAGEPERRFVFDFNHDHGVEPKSLKSLLGGKGANLAEMVSVLGLPVPPGFTISTDACRDYMAGGWPKRLDAEVAEARTRLEDLLARRRIRGAGDDGRAVEGAHAVRAPAVAAGCRPHGAMW